MQILMQLRTEKTAEELQRISQLLGLVPFCAPGEQETVAPDSSTVPTPMQFCSAGRYAQITVLI